MPGKSKEKDFDLKYKEIVQDWGDKSVQATLSARIDEWLNNFTCVEQQILLELLNHYSYFSDDKIPEYICALYAKYQKTKNAQKEETVYIPVFNETGVGNSDEFFNKFWFHNSLIDYCTKDVYTLLEAEQQIRFITIVDDYSGSGSSIITTIKKCLASRTNQELSFTILTIQISNVAVEAIKTFAEEQSISVDIVNLFVDDKCFDSNYIYKSKEESVDKKQKYGAVWETHGYQQKDFKYGYKKVQGLLSFEYDTPNNTLGIFWCDNNSVKPLFKRTKREKTNLRNMQYNAKRRKEERKVDKILFSDMPPKLMYMLSHLQSSKVIHYDETRQKCGLSVSEMDENLNYLLDKKFIYIESGYMKISDSMQKLVFPKATVSPHEEKKEFKEKEYLPKNIKKVFNGYKNNADT